MDLPGHVDHEETGRCICRFEVLATAAQVDVVPQRRGGMTHSASPDHAAAPRLLDVVDTDSDRELGGEMLTVPTIRACRTPTAKIRHARYVDPLIVAQWLQPYVLAAAA